MPPTTPYAGKFSSYSSSSRPQPHSPYHSGQNQNQAQNPAQDKVYSTAYRSGDDPYDMPHASYRGCSVSSVTARERHHSTDCPVSENPYGSPPPRSPRQHGASCPARAYRHNSSGSGGGGEPPSRNGSVTARGRIYGPAITASYGEMCYHDNSLVSASLEALIQHLVPTVDYYPDVRRRRV